MPIICGIKRSATTRAKPAAREGTRPDAHLGRIVRVLSDHAMLVVSGTKLAQEIGTSRSEVWRLVQQLRSLGVRITGHPATGYRLEAFPDLLLPEILEPEVKGTIFGGHLHHYFRVGSTNVVGMQAGQAGEPEGMVYFAEEQTAGRGRGGHSWHSARDGIYVSVLLRPPISPADVVALSLMAGVATQAAVEQVSGIRADLRWPNDLLLAHETVTESGTRLEERKFCGILTELNAETTRVRFAVAGIGINVNQPAFPAELEGLATSLRIETGRTWPRVALAAALLNALDREYKRLLGVGGCEQLFRRFEEASSYARGRCVQVDEDGGYTGVTAGLDARGFLLVRGDDGATHTVLSGGVRAI